MTDQLSLCTQDIEDILEEDDISVDDFGVEDLINHVKNKLEYPIAVIRNAVSTIKFGVSHRASCSFAQPK